MSDTENIYDFNVDEKEFVKVEDIFPFHDFDKNQTFVGVYEKSKLIKVDNKQSRIYIFATKEGRFCVGGFEVLKAKLRSEDNEADINIGHIIKMVRAAKKKGNYYPFDVFLGPKATVRKP